MPALCENDHVVDTSVKAMQKLDSNQKPVETANCIHGSMSSRGQIPPTRAALSPRQTEIAGLVALGLSDKEIANRLHLTEGTIGWHLKEIFKKWQIHSRTILVAQFGQAIASKSDAAHPLTNVRVVKRPDFDKIQMIEKIARGYVDAQRIPPI